MQFSWDPTKAGTNLQKHGVSFEEALSVFRDRLAVIHDDPEHSIGERREIIIGHSDANRLLLVSFTERGDVIRIINARLPDAAERRHYEEGTR